jgi:hypothetical protein
MAQQTSVAVSHAVAFIMARSTLGAELPSAAPARAAEQIVPIASPTIAARDQL